VPAPSFGRTVELTPVSGTVLVRAPGQARFTRLTARRLVPVGTVVSTIAGQVRLSAATATPGHIQTGEFHAGTFSIRQPRPQGGLTDLMLIDNRSVRAACGSAQPRAGLGARILGLLRGDAHGGFSTVGRFAAATVRGTQWGVRNLCDGTFVVVQEGIVVVRDFRRHRNVTLRTGQTYLATAG
jgi:hypothetical protein